MSNQYENKLGAQLPDYAHVVAQTDAFEAKMRDDEDRKTPQGRNRLRLRIEASKREIANRDPSLK